VLQCSHMANTKTPLVIANWKMNPKTLADAKQIFTGIRKKVQKHRGTVDVAIAATFPFLSDLSRLSPSGAVAIAAQDSFFEVAGAYTGEVSLPMLQSVGVTAVIVGHSERRAAGETDEEVFKDTKAILQHKLTPIICVGEKVRDENGQYFSTIEFQVRAALADVPKTRLSQIVIAYEPIWAIGTGDTASAEDALEIKLFIQKILTDKYGRAAAQKVRILYGGSVKSKNAEALYTEGEVDGFLVGGASLHPDEFGAIVKTVADQQSK